MFRLALVAALMVVSFAATQLDNEWAIYKKTYNKLYNEVEEAKRLACLKSFFHPFLL